MPHQENVALINTEPVFYNIPDEPSPCYVNAWQTKVSNSEVTLLMGYTVETTPEQQVIRKTASIVVTHESFVKMADSFQKALEIVKIMHGGELPAEIKPTPDQVNEIQKKFSGARAQMGRGNE